MDYSAAQKRIDDLKSQINYHSNRYYNMDDPEISDYEYDMMMNELKQLEKEFPDIDVTYSKGEQPIYYYIIAVE